MCNPTAFAAMSFIGTMVSSYGQLQAGRAAKDEADYRAGIARNNAAIADQNAETALEKGRVDVEDKKRETLQAIGLQRAQLAAQGFDVSAGSSIDILGDTAALGMLDNLRIQADAENRAHSFRTQADSFLAESGLLSLAGENAQSASRIGAVGTLIGGAARAGSGLLDKKATKKP